MGWAQIKPWLDTEHGSVALKEQYERYCNWCWYHDSGSCDYCKKEFGKMYRPIRIRELLIKYGFKAGERE